MADDLRKERLAFISGTILVWGILLVRLWPTVASFQSGHHIRFWTINSPGEGVLTSVWIFWLLTCLLTLGMWAVGLAVAHILSYGLFVVTENAPQGGGVTNQVQSSLERVSSNTYIAVFIQWFIVPIILGLTVIILLSAGLEQFLGHFLSVRWAGWIVRGIVLIFILVLFLIFRDRFLKMFRFLEEQVGFPPGIYVVVLLGFAFSWLVVIEFCNTVSLIVDTKIVRRDAGATITVELGGATSDPREASLLITDDKGAVVRSFPLNQVSEGSYIAYVAPASLSWGFYHVVLKYPHSSITGSFPFIRSVTTRSQGLMVAP
jgi:hypothetical protein